VSLSTGFNERENICLSLWLKTNTFDSHCHCRFGLLIHDISLHATSHFILSSTPSFSGHTYFIFHSSDPCDTTSTNFYIKPKSAFLIARKKLMCRKRTRSLPLPEFDPAVSYSQQTTLYVPSKNLLVPTGKNFFISTILVGICRGRLRACLILFRLWFLEVIAYNTKKWHKHKLI